MKEALESVPKLNDAVWVIHPTMRRRADGRINTGKDMTVYKATVLSYKVESLFLNAQSNSSNPKHEVQMVNGYTAEVAVAVPGNKQFPGETKAVLSIVDALLFNDEGMANAALDYYNAHGGLNIFTGYRPSVKDGSERFDREGFKAEQDRKPRANAVYRCPECGCYRFAATAHVTQQWALNERGTFDECINEAEETTHAPSEDDMWECRGCGFYAEGKAFRIDKSK